MSNVKSIKVGYTSYNVAMASAVDGKRLLLLVGGQVAFKSATANIKEIDGKLLIGVMLTLPEKTFDEVAQIALSKTVVNGGDSLVQVEDFQGRMLEFFQLVAEAVKYNLNDFFTFLDSENAERRKAN